MDNNRINKIKAYAIKKEEEKRKKQKAENDKKAELIKEIKSLDSDIAELVDTANACLKAGIEINKYGKYGNYYDSYGNGTFVANAISHKLGFVIEEKNAVLGIGILKTGENCEFDLISEDGNVYVRRTYRDSSGIKQRKKVDDSFHLSVSHFEYFLKVFPAFKESFYKYVDGILEAADGEK